MKPLCTQEKVTEKGKIWQMMNENAITNIQTKDIFNFDKVYSDEMTTAEIFHQDAKSLVLSALEGYNVTIFAYGQTASGKTFTMRGTEEHQGIIPLALGEIFKVLNEQHGKPFSFRDHHQICHIDNSWNLKVSYIEIYNECVNDLLDPTKKNLDIRESRQKGIYIDGLSEFEVVSLQDTIGYLLKGDEQRAFAETKLNQKSSRSHTVFKINVIVREKNQETGKFIIRTSQINLVDLAGSEGVNKTKSEGVRFREGTNINKSLLALSNVICKLGQKYQQQQKNYYINFRDSKLTRILQQPLSGNSQTAIICTMSQLLSNYQESRETLNFGSKAKILRTLVNINEIVKEQPEQISNKIKQLTKENEELRLKVRVQDDFDCLFEENKENYGTLGYMKSHIDYLNKLIDDKNEAIALSEQQNLKLQEKCDEVEIKLEQVEKSNVIIQKKFDELMVFNVENLAFNEQLIKNREKLELKIQELESQLSTYKPKQQRAYSIDNTMHNIYPIQQQSKLDISTTSLVSRVDHENDETININENMQQDVLNLMSENEKLKSTIRILQQTKEDMDLQQAQQQQVIQNFREQLQSEKDAKLRAMQSLRIIRLESRRKDKYLTKKNFLIQQLQEKIDLLQRSNTNLFKELDNSIQGVSVIHNESQIEMIDQYLNGEQPSESEVQENPNQKNEFVTSSQKAQLMELMTKIEILENDKRNLEYERDSLQTDLDEAEKNIEKLTMEIKDMDYEIMEVYDENDELENDNQQIAHDYRAALGKISRMKEHIERLEFDLKTMVDELRNKDSQIDQLNTQLVDKDRIIIDLEEANRLLQFSKKRTREEFQATNVHPSNAMTTADHDNLASAKKFKLNSLPLSDRENLNQNNITSNLLIDNECKYHNILNTLTVVTDMQTNQNLLSKIGAQIKMIKQESNYPSKQKSTPMKIVVNDSDKENQHSNLLIKPASSKNKETSQDIMKRMSKNFKNQVALQSTDRVKTKDDVTFQ